MSHVVKTPALPPLNPWQPRYGFLLVAFCALLYGLSVVDGRTLTSHETTHCLNVREMAESGNWLIATYGGRPWLERPTLPHVLTLALCQLGGGSTVPGALRLASVIVGSITVVLWSWALSGLLGGRAALAAGLLLATMREWLSYATGPEADIYLASVVTVAGSLLLKAELTPVESLSFWGQRSWHIWAFFILAGLTNAMKGPLFGTIFLALALAGSWLLAPSLAQLRRYFWLWGLLVYLVIGAAWPVAAYLQHPDVAQVWQSDYGKRWNTNYIGEPAWYYLVQVPWNLFPWTLPALVGLVILWRDRDRRSHPGWRLILAWAILPPILLSAFRGKHHHYMLSQMAPWSALAWVGLAAWWRWGQTHPRWLKSPLVAAVLSLPLVLVVIALGHKLPAPANWQYVAAVLIPVLAGFFWSFCYHPVGSTAFTRLILGVALLHGVAYTHRTWYLDDFAGEKAFFQQVRLRVPLDQPVYLMNDQHPLNASWPLYYYGSGMRLLHNHTFLAADDLPTSFYLVCRGADLPFMHGYGEFELVHESGAVRGGNTPENRYQLYRVTLRSDLPRYPRPHVNGMQATGRADGPFLPRP